MTTAPIPRNVPPKVGSARGRVAVLTRTGADPAVIEAARAQLDEANAEADILRWPPFPAETRARLACLVLSGGDDDAA